MCFINESFDLTIVYSIKILFQGQSEFQFSETEGEIGPYEVRQLHVIFKPHVPRSLKSFIECTVENGTGKYVPSICSFEQSKTFFFSNLN